MEFLPFFLILFAAVFFSEVFERLHLPWVVALILGGVAIGPFGFGWVTVDDTVHFFGQIGLVFLMFMAGLETRFSEFRQARSKLITMGVLNAGIPFLAGMAVALAFGMSLPAAFLLGIIFISSAIAVVIPSLEANNLLVTRPGKIVTPVTVFEDIFSLILLAVFLQVTLPESGILTLPVWMFLTLFVLSVIVLRLLVSKMRWFISLGDDERGTGREAHDFRVVLTILLGSVVVFSVLGLHPIVGGFFAGLILSDTITRPVMKERFKVVGYGIFIPVFFIIVGAQTDISVFFQLGAVLALTGAVVGASMATKFLSGFFAGRIIGFSVWESSLIGVATLPQLSITLAVAFMGVELGIIPEDLAVALVVLTVITTLIAPILIRWIGRKLDVTVV